METLVCTRCDKEWERQKVRGRKPKLCPDCKALKDAPAAPPAQPEAKVEAEAIRSSYCGAKLHLICKEEMVKFPEIWGNCTCKCHVTKP